MEITDIIQGEEIYLRQLKTGDVNENYFNWMNSKEVVQFLEARFSDNSMDGIRNFVEGVLKSKNNVFLAIVTKKDDKHIGNVKLGPIDFNHKTAVLGIIIGDKGEWGKGYATKTIELITNYGFEKLGLHKITAGCYDNNLGSKKAFEKAGYVIEAKLKEQYLFEGKYVDQYLFAKFKR